MCDSVRAEIILPYPQDTPAMFLWGTEHTDKAHEGRNIACALWLA